MENPEPTPSDELIKLLKTSLPLSSDWWEISDGLRAIEVALPGPQIEWLRVAFEHPITNEIIMGPRRETPLLSNREAFKKIAPEVLIYWDAVSTQTTCAPIRARLRHLLFLAKYEDVSGQARNAIAAYSEIAKGTWDRLDKVSALEWALYLSRLISDDTTTMEAVSGLLAIADVSLDQVESEPGVSLTALEVLARHDPSLSQLSALLERARNAYPDPFLTQDTIKIQKLLLKSDPAGVRELHRQEVESYREKALGSEGMQKMAFLDKAAKLAQAYGLSVLHDSIVVEMQGLGIDSLGLVEIRSEYKMSEEESKAIQNWNDSWIAAVVGQPTLLEALTALVSHVAPSGNLSQNEKSASYLASASVFRSFITTTHVRPDGLSDYSAVSEEDQRDERLSEVELQTMFGPFQFHTRALIEILGRFRPTLTELTSLLIKEPQVSAATARTLAKALLHFQDGDYESAATNIAPKIETVGRALLAELGVAIYRVQQGQKRPGIQQLSPIISDLKTYLDPSWHRFLQTFLVGRFGGNFRNDLLHGYLEEVSPIQSALVLIATLHLAFLEVVHDSEAFNAPGSGDGAVAS